MIIQLKVKSSISHRKFASVYLKQILEARLGYNPWLKKNMKNKRNPQFISKIKSIRRIVKTLIGQLDETLNLGIVWARDGRHLTARIARKLFTHTIGAFLNKQLGKSIIKFDGLITV